VKDYAGLAPNITVLKILGFRKGRAGSSPARGTKTPNPYLSLKRSETGHSYRFTAFRFGVFSLNFNGSFVETSLPHFPTESAQTGVTETILKQIAARSLGASSTSKSTAFNGPDASSLNTSRTASEGTAHGAHTIDQTGVLE
jgi:hypothetical protein